MQWTKLRGEFDLHYANIKTNDIANGPGIRLSLFVSGCTNHCKDCFNKETWDFNFGTEYTAETEQFILSELSKERYDGITILGGEPFEKENQPTVLNLIQKIRKILPTRTIWIYTGFTYEKDLNPGGKRYIPGTTDQILSTIDVLVDGRFEKDLYSIMLVFRGSSNQRIIDMKKSNYDNIIIKEI